MKLQEIKKFVREFKMPNELVLNQWSTITDLEKFFESHITVLDNISNTKKIKMLHYERVMKAINLLRKNKGMGKTTMNISENIEISKTPPPIKQNNKTNNNDIDFTVIEEIENKSVIKPNKDFEQKRELFEVKKEKSYCKS